jgi:hypothetical protein
MLIQLPHVHDDDSLDDYQTAKTQREAVGIFNLLGQVWENISAVVDEGSADSYITLDFAQRLGLQLIPLPRSRFSLRQTPLGTTIPTHSADAELRLLSTSTNGDIPCDVAGVLLVVDAPSTTNEKLVLGTRLTACWRRSDSPSSEFSILAPTESESAEPATTTRLYVSTISVWSADSEEARSEGFSSPTDRIYDWIPGGTVPEETSELETEQDDAPTTLEEMSPRRIHWKHALLVRLSSTVPDEKRLIDAASEWPAERVCRWLRDKNFSPSCRAVFGELELAGIFFTELAKEGSDEECYTISTLIYPRMCIKLMEKLGRGIAVHQVMRREGGRLRRLAREALANSFEESPPRLLSVCVEEEEEEEESL